MFSCFSNGREDDLERENENLTGQIQLLQRNVENLSREAMQRSKDILGTVRRSEDGKRAPKRSRTSADEDRPTFQRHFRDLHVNLDDLETDTVKTKEENVNLRSKVADLAERFKQKEEECNGFRATCTSALQLLSGYQIGRSNFTKPQQYSVALNDGISKLLGEFNRSEKENVSLSQRETDLETNMKRFQTDVTKVELMNNNLKRENLELRTALDKARAFSNSYSKLDQSKETPKTDEEEEVLRVLSKLRDYEAQMKTLDVSAMNGKLKDLTKSLAKTYGREIRDLHMEILKLLEALKDDQINKQHETFAHAIKSKTEALQEAQENCRVLSPDELRKKFRGGLAEDARAIEGELEIFRQIIFDFPAVEAQRRAAYDDIVSALNRELGHLRDVSSSNCSSARRENLVTFDLPADDVLLKDSYVKQTLERIVEINKSTRELEVKVNKFRGSKTSKIFLDLEHQLMNNIMSVDTIQVHGHEVIREKRREAVKYAHQCMDKLTNNVVDV